MRKAFWGIAFLLLLQSCSSFKSGIKNGDYYATSVDCIEKLHHQPQHQKSISALTKVYPIAVDVIESGVRKSIESEDPEKWNKAIEGYTKINILAEKIKNSLGAREVVAEPITRYKELASIKTKAAEENYQKGIQLLMKNTRSDAKKAIQCFKEANEFQPGYREVIEMINQAEYNATFHVAFLEIDKVKEFNITLEPIINAHKKPFLSFVPFNPTDSIKPQQKLTIVFNAYRIDSKPTLTQELNEKGTTNSVQLSAQSEAIVTITDMASGADLINYTVQGNSLYSNTWATNREANPSTTFRPSGFTGSIQNNSIQDDLLERSLENLKKNIDRLLTEFYSRY